MSEADWSQSLTKAHAAAEWLAEATLVWMIGLTAGFLARERAVEGEGWSSTTWAFVAKHVFLTSTLTAAAAIAWPDPEGLAWAARGWIAAAAALGVYVANLPARL